MPSAPAKSCVVCGVDVSSKPRFKDAKGQYACKACHESIQKNAAARALSNQPVEPPPLLPLPATGGGFSPEPGSAPTPATGVTPCPACGAPRGGGAVVCMTCGFNSATGKALITKKGVAKEPKAKRARPRIQVGGAIVPLVAGAILGLLFLGAMNSDDLRMAYGGAVMLYGFCFWAALVIIPFVDDHPLWGWCAILISIVMVWYVLFVTERRSLKVALLVDVLALVEWGFLGSQRN